MQINRITPDVNIAYSPTEAGDIGYGFGEWVAKTSVIGKLSEVLSNPGLFGSYPIVNTKNRYTAFLMTYYIKSDGRRERYSELDELLDETLSN